MRYFYSAIFVILASCGQTNNNSDKNELVNIDAVVSEPDENTSVRSFKLTDKTVKFLWRADKYDEAFKDTFNSIIIDEDYCKTITEPERAVLGYVATFIGNECNWDGDYKEDRSNLKCKLLTALNLGYQCSDKHLGFLRQMFKNDPKVLEELKSDNCPTIPDGATIQYTFDEITLNIKGNLISVSFKANGVNMRASESWSRSETDYFQFDKDNIKLLKKDESKVEHKTFDIDK